MKGLRKVLTPFAPDQSGAATVLYSLGGMIVIIDAGGCTGNICGFDEPRWHETRAAIFSAGLQMDNRGGKKLIEMGILSKKLLKQFDLQQPVYFAELNWTQLMKATRKNEVLFSEVPKFPAVSRDLALLVDNAVEFAQIEQIARQAEKKLLKKVELFDVYEGKNLPEGKKSYAVNFILQDEEKTMNDKQIDAVMQKLIVNLKKQLGAELR